MIRIFYPTVYRFLSWAFGLLRMIKLHSPMRKAIAIGYRHIDTSQLIYK